MKSRRKGKIPSIELRIKLILTRKTIILSTKSIHDEDEDSHGHENIHSNFILSTIAVAIFISTYE